MIRSQRVLAAAALLLAACSRDPYRVGVWTGPTGANVAKMAESEVNIKTGVAGRRMVTRVVSQRTVSFNELTPEALRISLDSMASDTMVRGVVMRMTDSITEEAAQKFESLGIPYLITTPVSAAYMETHPHAFLLVPTIEEQSQFLVAQALRTPKPQRVAIINVREPHADALAAATTRELASHGITPVFATSFSQAADRYNILAKAEETTTHKPTVIFFIGRTPSLFEMYGTMVNRLPDAAVIGSDLVESFHLYGNPGQRYTGVRFVRLFDPRSSDSLTVGLRDRLWGWIGRDELNSEAAVTYDAIKGMAELMNQGALSRDSLNKVLRSGVQLKGILGTWQFDENRRARRALQLAEVKADRIVEVKADETALARKPD
ncbi:MAG: ABC transporter substrate-binding protein [Longimicrobiales bacterium]